jgi:predicted Fe-S protein YdhL (DUF1289 family)
MKKRICALVLVCLFAVMAGCTRTIYGVPEETWNTMSEAERLEAIRTHKERQVAYQKAQAERARLRAIELKKQKALATQEASKRRKRVEAIYRGLGDYGDLLRVTMRGGKVKISGKKRQYDPIGFKIADGETKSASVVSGNRRANLQVSYLDGTLTVDEYRYGSRIEGVRLVYEQAWGSGKTYADLSSDGPLRMRGVDVYVEIVGKSEDRSAPVPVSEGQASPVVTVQQTTTVTTPPPQIIVVTGQAAAPPLPDPRGAAAAEKSDSVPNVVEKLRRLKITLSGGAVLVRGNFQSFDPVTFSLSEGESVNVAIPTRSNAPRRLLVTYRDRVLYLDGKPGRHSTRTQPTKIGYASEWRRGKKYRITTNGDVQLRNVSLFVKETNT